LTCSRQCSGSGSGTPLLADDAVEDQVEKTVLGADVPVQRAGRGVQRARHVAHAQLVEAVGVEDLECGVDDRLLGQRLAPAARRTPRAHGGGGGSAPAVSRRVAT